MTVAKAEMIIYLFKDWATQYGLVHIINVTKTGTGGVEAQSRNLVGIDYHYSDLGNLKNILKDIHALTTDHVQAYSGWYIGHDNSTLTTSI